MTTAGPIFLHFTLRDIATIWSGKEIIAWNDYSWARHPTSRSTQRHTMVCIKKCTARKCCKKAMCYTHRWGDIRLKLILVFRVLRQKHLSIRTPWSLPRQEHRWILKEAPKIRIHTRTLFFCFDLIAYSPSNACKVKKKSLCSAAHHFLPSNIMRDFKALELLSLRDSDVYIHAVPRPILRYIYLCPCNLLGRC